jgi:hypothetical protein
LPNVSLPAAALALSLRLKIVNGAKPDNEEDGCAT